MYGIHNSNGKDDNNDNDPMVYDNMINSGGSGSGNAAKQLVSEFPRTVYFSGCDHAYVSYISNLSLDTWYYCEKCVIYRKISEINY